MFLNDIGGVFVGGFWGFFILIKDQNRPVASLSPWPWQSLLRSSNFLKLLSSFENRTIF